MMSVEYRGMNIKFSKWRGYIALLMAVQMLLFTGCGAADDNIAASSEQEQTVAQQETPEQEQTVAQQETPEQEQTVAQQETPEQEQIATQTSAAWEQTETASETELTADPTVPIDRDGTYTSKDDVALYLYTYGELPDNFITKKEAQALGWSGGSLEPYAPGKCIGGDKFGNYEGVLPQNSYHECDIDTLGAKSRGAKRIVYSDDGDIYYTQDHYESFELLYGGE
jgi:guanyl-specific ribonuclease Sa